MVEAHEAPARAEGKLREFQVFQLDILREFKRICDEHGLRWWLAYGTLLGAARHEGFIPWDDDIDVAMPPEDYLRFREVAPESLSDGFYLQCHGVNPCNFIEWQRIGVTSSTSMPYAYADVHAEWGVCMDIFPFFPAPSADSPERKKVDSLEATVSRLAAKYYYRHEASAQDSLARKVYYKLMGAVPDGLNKKMWLRAERRLLNGLVDESPYYRVFGDNRDYPRSMFERTAYLPFEGMELPVPSEYRRYLEICYGPDWNELPPAEKRVWHSGGGSDEVLVSLTEPYANHLK